MNKLAKKRFLWGFLVVTVLFVSSLAVFRDFRGFVFAIFRHPTQVGAAAPSSSYLAQKITKNILGVEERQEKPIKILEVGAGTGVFTEEIARKITDKDTLDVIEIDSGLCEILKQKFADKKNITIHCKSILEFDPGYKYDFIVSGLPFNAFDYNFVKDILDKYKEIIEPNGVISYFEYIFIGAVKKFFIFGQKKADLEKNIQLRKDFIKAYGFDRDTILVNFPPAYVYHLRIKS